MEDYSKYISPKRRPVDSPSCLVKDGNCAFGVFKDEIEVFDLHKAKNPTKAPDFMNKLRLTLWEAFELNVKDGLLVSGICNMGLFGRVVNVFYDCKEQKIYKWGHNYAPWKVHIASNLINNSITEIKTAKRLFKFVNDFKKRKAVIECHEKNKQGQIIDYKLNLTMFSVPSVVSMPFGKNKPVYTEKAMFKAEGQLNIAGKNYPCDENSFVIIDDHKGYYPYKSHYDWITFLGKSKENFPLGLNLTQNQCLDPDNINETLLWLNEGLSLLPKVRFSKQGASCRKFKSEKETPLTWEIKDEHDMVNLTCTIQGVEKTDMNVGFICIHYYITFGTLHGYVRDEKGHKYDMEGLNFIGEDKTVKF